MNYHAKDFVLEQFMKRAFLIMSAALSCSGLAGCSWMSKDPCSGKDADLSNPACVVESKQTYRDNDSRWFCIGHLEAKDWSCASSLEEAQTKHDAMSKAIAQADRGSTEVDALESILNLEPAPDRRLDKPNALLTQMPQRANAAALKPSVVALEDETSGAVADEVAMPTALPKEPIEETLAMTALQQNPVVSLETVVVHAQAAPSSNDSLFVDVKPVKAPILEVVAIDSSDTEIEPPKNELSELKTLETGQTERDEAEDPQIAEGLQVNADDPGVQLATSDAGTQQTPAVDEDASASTAMNQSISAAKPITGASKGSPIVTRTDPIAAVVEVAQVAVSEPATLVGHENMRQDGLASRDLKPARNIEKAHEKQIAMAIFENQVSSSTIPETTAAPTRIASKTLALETAAVLPEVGSIEARHEDVKKISRVTTQLDEPSAGMIVDNGLTTEPAIRLEDNLKDDIDDKRITAKSVLQPIEDDLLEKVEDSTVDAALVAQAQVSEALEIAYDNAETKMAAKVFDASPELPVIEESVLIDDNDDPKKNLVAARPSRLETVPIDEANSVISVSTDSTTALTSEPMSLTAATTTALTQGLPATTRSLASEASTATHHDLAFNQHLDRAPFSSASDIQAKPTGVPTEIAVLDKSAVPAPIKAPSPVIVLSETETMSETAVVAAVEPPAIAIKTATPEMTRTKIAAQTVAIKGIAAPSAIEAKQEDLNESQNAGTLVEVSVGMPELRSVKVAALPNNRAISTVVEDPAAIVEVPNPLVIAAIEAPVIEALAESGELPETLIAPVAELTLIEVNEAERTLDAPPQALLAAANEAPTDDIELETPDEAIALVATESRPTVVNVTMAPAAIEVTLPVLTKSKATSQIAEVPVQMPELTSAIVSVATNPFVATEIGAPIVPVELSQAADAAAVEIPINDRAAQAPRLAAGRTYATPESRVSELRDSPTSTEAAQLVLADSQVPVPLAGDPIERPESASALITLPANLELSSPNAVPMAADEVPAADKEAPAADREVPVVDKEVLVANKEELGSEIKKSRLADKEEPLAHKEVLVADKELPEAFEAASPAFLVNANETPVIESRSEVFEFAVTVVEATDEPAVESVSSDVIVVPTLIEPVQPILADTQSEFEAPSTVTAGLATQALTTPDRPNVATIASEIVIPATEPFPAGTTLAEVYTDHVQRSEQLPAALQTLGPKGALPLPAVASTSSVRRSDPQVQRNRTPNRANEQIERPTEAEPLVTAVASAAKLHSIPVDPPELDYDSMAPACDLW